MSSSKQASGLQHQQVVRQRQAAPAAVWFQVAQTKSPADMGPCCSTDNLPHVAIVLAQWDGVDCHPGHVLVRWVQLSRLVCCCRLKLVTQTACMQRLSTLPHGTMSWQAKAPGPALAFGTVTNGTVADIGGPSTWLDLVAHAFTLQAGARSSEAGLTAH